jgi:ribosome recycling factor
MANENMQGALFHLTNELTKIRAGKADAHMLDGLFVDYYGSSTPINQVCNIHTPDPRQIVIQPWEKTMIEPIEKSILKANLGLNPINNGELIRLNIPALTEERRRQLVKQVKNEGENTKISIRSARRDTNDEVKKLKNSGLSEDLAKDAEIEVQNITNTFIGKVDELIVKKEKDIMTI